MKTTIKHAGIRILIVPALCCLLFFINSCNNTNDPMYNTKTTNTTTTQGANEVYIQGMAYSPATLTITTGTTVKWTNKDGVTHTVTSDSTLFNSGNILANGVYTYTFNTVGTYPYHCTFHPTMKAVIVVNAYVPPTGY